jgi:hypothetical protein
VKLALAPLVFMETASLRRCTGQRKNKQSQTDIRSLASSKFVRRILTNLLDFVFLATFPVSLYN